MNHEAKPTDGGKVQLTLSDTNSGYWAVLDYSDASKFADAVRKSAHDASLNAHPKRAVLQGAMCALVTLLYLTASAWFVLWGEPAGHPLAISTGITLILIYVAVLTAWVEVYFPWVGKALLVVTLVATAGVAISALAEDRQQREELVRKLHSLEHCTPADFQRGIDTETVPWCSPKPHDG